MDWAHHLLKTAFQKWMASTIKFWMSLTFKNSLPNMDDHAIISNFGCVHTKTPIQKCMTSTMQFCMDIMLNNYYASKNGRPVQSNFG